MKWDKQYRWLKVGVVLTAILFSACSGEQCLAFDLASPPVRILINDAQTGEPLCGATISPNCRTEYRSAIPPVPCLVAYEDICEYWLYDWTSMKGGKKSPNEITIEVEQYLPQTIEIQFERNECGDIVELSPIEIDVELDPDYEE